MLGNQRVPNYDECVRTPLLQLRMPLRSQGWDHGLLGIGDLV